MARRRYGFRPYVPVAVRRQRANKKLDTLRRRGLEVQPVEISGRKIAKTFWGAAWCEHLEGFGDFANRLPRGRTYVRNGSVCHLEIARGKIEARVAGSQLYQTEVEIKPLPTKRWEGLKQRCGGRIGSLLELLAGRLSDEVMQEVTDREQGLFPRRDEIQFGCSCPDWAVMCKHVSAVLYGVGARLDERPELLFLLRGVDHEELIAADAQAAVDRATSGDRARRLEDEDLGALFGIDLGQQDDQGQATEPAGQVAASNASNKVGRKAADKRSSKKVGKQAGKKQAGQKRAQSAKKQASAENRPTKKNTAKKSAAKKTSAKQATRQQTAKSGPAPKKSAPKEASAKKTSAKKSPAKKAAGGKSTPKKAPNKSTTAKRAPRKKASSTNTAPGKGRGTKPSANKPSGKKAGVKKAGVKKAAAGKTAGSASPKEDRSAPRTAARKKK